MGVVRIGLLGCGSIGGFLARHVLAEAVVGAIELSYVYDVDEKRMQEIPPPCRVTAQADSLPGRSSWWSRPRTPISSGPWPCAWWSGPTCCCSRSRALADDAFRTTLERTAVEHGRRVFVPHGAIIGIDGLVDAGSTLKSVTVTTTKSPASLGLPPERYQVVYEGPVRDACAKFPRNVNVHAAIALAGLGLDRTVSRIVADPAVSTNSHLVEVEGAGYRFRIEVSSEAGGKAPAPTRPKRPEHASPPVRYVRRPRRPAFRVTRCRKAFTIAAGPQATPPGRKPLRGKCLRCLVRLPFRQANGDLPQEKTVSTAFAESAILCRKRTGTEAQRHVGSPCAGFGTPGRETNVNATIERRFDLGRPLRVAVVSKADRFGGGASLIAEQLAVSLSAAGHTAHHWVAWWGDSLRPDMRSVYGIRYRKAFFALHRIVGKLGLQELVPWEYAILRRHLHDYDLAHFHESVRSSRRTRWPWWPGGCPPSGRSTIARRSRADACIRWLARSSMGGAAAVRNSDSGRWTAASIGGWGSGWISPAGPSGQAARGTPRWRRAGHPFAMDGRRGDEVATC